MQKSLLLLTFILISFFSQAQSTYFTSDPHLSPDASQIVFSYNGDLWMVPTEGGQAYQLTAMEGNETRPQFSPDGKHIAFSGTQYGNKDLYIVPVSGGDITQLTYHSAFDDLDGWSWDSRTLYFTSNRENRYAGYTIPVSGGTPKRIFPHYFNTVHNLAVHPSDGRIFFNESWESKNFAHRKRYKGAYNPDIKSYNPVSKEYKEYTDYDGKDYAVTIDQKGNIYFLSDQHNGEYNLYQLRDGNSKRLTNFKTSAFWPKVSANGEKIVFRKDYQIHVYDVKSGKTTTPNIQIYRHSSLDKDDNFKTGGNISSFALSPDKKKLAFVSRGKLFVSDAKGKFIQQRQTHPREAVSEVHWLKDNKTLLYSRSVNGYYNWFTLAADGSTSEKKWTSDIHNNRLLSFNSDRSKATYLGGRNQVRIMDLESMESVIVAEDELWGFYNDPPSFSPDDQYILFSAYRNFEQDMMIYSLKDKTTQNISHTYVTENNAVWGPDGKYIYFISNPTRASYPYGLQNSDLYRVPLARYENPYRTEKFAELFVEEDKEEKKDSSDQQKDKANEEDKMQVVIESEGLMDRMRRIGPAFGDQRAPYVFKDGEKTRIIYLSSHDEGQPTLWMTTLEDFEDPKTEKVGKGPMFGYQIQEEGGSYFVLSGGHLHSFNPGGKKLDKIDLEFTFTKNLEDEFVQMYYEAWAGMEQNFYDENFHGENWQELRDQYAAFLPHISRRSDLRLIFNDMLGELNTSHFGFFSNGREESVYNGQVTQSLGVEWESAAPYTVKRIITDGPADLYEKKLQPGDRVVAINGVAIDATSNREKYFTHPARTEEWSISVMRNGAQHEISMRPMNAFSVATLLYDEWQDANQAYVDQKGEGKIAYIHMKNMGGGELAKFKRDMVREGEYREGLILDLRYNTGGNVHDEVINWLSRKQYLQWKYREGKLTPQPNFSPGDMPIVLLINEQSLSDAEMTSAGFKQLGLGTIVGMETYRWIIFTSGLGLVDGSFYRLPSWGCYTMDGDNLEKTGVTPDIEVDKDFADRMEGHHPQLDKAIEIIMEKLRR